MRIRLSDPSLLGELGDFFRTVHAVPVRREDVLEVQLIGGEAATNERQLHAYLETWLKFHGVDADVE